MKKLIIAVLVLSFLGFIGWKVYDGYTKEVFQVGRTRGKPRIPVEVEAVRKADIQDIGNFTGTLKPKSLFLVAPKVSGRLESLLVNVGDRLYPNQLIAMLDDDEFQQQLQQAEATLEVAKATLEAAEEQMLLAKREMRRVEKLKDRKLVSDSELDAAKTAYSTRLSAYRVAKAQLEQKKAAIEGDRIRLSYTKITNIWSDSDTALVVGEKYVDEGALVGPTAPLISILDISSLVGVIHVTEKDYFKIDIGQVAEIKVDALPNRTFQGIVARIAPLIKEKSREARIEVVIPNNDNRLKPGLFIRASIRFKTHENTTVIPVSALVRREEEAGVFLLDQDQSRVTFINVKTGFMQDDRAEILSPDLRGYVVTLGQHLLEDGSLVTVPDEESRKPKRKPDQPRKPSMN